MLKLPNCDFCKHYLEESEIDCCLAFPGGIPLEAMVKAEKGVECLNGYSFEEKETTEEFRESPEDGLYRRILR